MSSVLISDWIWGADTRWGEGTCVLNTQYMPGIYKCISFSLSMASEETSIIPALGDCER